MLKIRDTGKRLLVKRCMIFRGQAAAHSPDTTGFFEGASGFLLIAGK